MEIEALFIGGPFDGLRRRVHADQAYIDLAERPKLPAFFGESSDAMTTAKERQHRYSRVRLRSESGETHTIFAFGSTDVISQLISKYPKMQEADPL